MIGLGRVCHLSGPRCCVQWTHVCEPIFLHRLEVASGSAPQCSNECSNIDCLKIDGN